MDEDGELSRSAKFKRTCHNMDIIVQNTGRDEYSLNGKSESQIRHWLISQGPLWLTQVTIRNVGYYTISITYVSPTELRICYTLMLCTSYVMYQDHPKNTSTYGVWDYTPSMVKLQ